MELNLLHPAKLVQFVDRVRKYETTQQEHYLHALLKNVLVELIEFLPSDAIVILLDDPIKKRMNTRYGELVYVAAMGKPFQSLVGQSIPSTEGILGEVYTLGRPMVRKANKHETIILDKSHSDLEIQSALCVPLKIEEAVVGTFGILNKHDAIGYTLRDLRLVEIFSGYISTAIQNVLDSRRNLELAKRDDLTGLYNDRYFHQQLQRELELAIARNAHLSLIFMDLDHFKSINDQYGHLVGSATLKEVGLIIREVFPFDNATLARYGGDEYVMILPGFSAEKTYALAEKLRIQIAEKLFMIPLGSEDGSFVSFKSIVSASIGVASLKEHIEPELSILGKKQRILRKADLAMYRSKELGKNCVTLASET